MSEINDITIIAQVVGAKTLKVTGGLRVELDCFEAREQDVLNMALLANRKVTAEITFRPQEQEKDNKAQRRRPGGKRQEKKEGSAEEEKAF